MYYTSDFFDSAFRKLGLVGAKLDGSSFVQKWKKKGYLEEDRYQKNN